MVKGAGKYRVWIEPEVHESREKLPGNVRQRIKRILGEFETNTKPANSRVLDVSDLDLSADIELCRVSLEKWRILYAVNENEKWVWVIQIHQRPPYDYEDLPEIASKLG